MKRVVTLTLSLMFVTIPLLSWVVRTRTISDSQLYDIRNSSINYGVDNLTHYLWNEYSATIRQDSTRVNEIDRSYSNTFGFESRALGTFINIVNDNAHYFGVANDFTWADSVRTYLHHFNWRDFKLAIYNPIGDPLNYQNTYGWASGWGSLEPYDRGRELCYTLMYYALIIDLLYNGSTTVAEQDQMDSILEDLADLQTWAYDTFINHDPTAWQTLGWEDNYNQTQPVGFCIDYGPTEPKMPEIGFSVNRVHLLSFIGYASLLLTDDPDSLDDDEDDLFNDIKKEFSSDFQLPSGSGCYGLNDYLTTATGMYHSGITYQNRVFYLGTLFFDALNRMGLANLYNNTNTWNCDVIPTNTA